MYQAKIQSSCRKYQVFRVLCKFYVSILALQIGGNLNWYGTFCKNLDILVIMTPGQQS